LKRLAKVDPLLANETMEVEANYSNDRCIAMTVYWGDFVNLPQARKDERML
jgi:hypothetical protein